MKKMRQNLQAIEHKALQKDNKTTIHYGLTINIDINDFNIENISLKENIAEINISTPKEVKITDVKKTRVQFKEEFENSFNKFHKENSAQITKIVVPKNHIIKEPITIHTNTVSKNTLQEFFFEIEENTEVTIIDVLSDQTKEDGYNSRLINILAKKGSKVNYFCIQKLNDKKVHYEKKVFIARESAKINIKEFSIGSKVSISETKTILEGQGASAKVQNNFFSSQKQQFDIKAEAIHKAKNTYSELLGKGVIKDSSKSLYRGNIHIQENAHNSEGFQKSKLLLIDKDAQADAIPQLLIDNNEVKCSHAVAIGRINSDKIFYFMTRGISEEEAKREIIRGFFESTLDGLDEQSADILREEIKRKT